MITWMLFFAAFWLMMIALFSYRSFKKANTADEYIFAGSNIGVFIGLLTFAATLFSTFTFMGMPDFFRIHGVGAWIFLAISDGVMFFFIIWFGNKIRTRCQAERYNGVSGLISSCYRSKWSGYVFFTGAFIFLVPYVSIQIRGISIFFNAIFPDLLPAWGWSAAIVIIMLLYSELGGLRAIIYSDAMQAVILLSIIWVIAIVCINKAGGLAAMFDQIRQSNPGLLSVPGPKGLFTFQFLLASLIAIVMMPVTQPQITTRIMIMKNRNKMNRMAVSMGVFTFLIILATAFIGMYGGIKYVNSATSDFLSNVLLFEQLDAIAALVVIGLLAAAISTADSQIFALGTELRSLLKGDEKKIMVTTRLAIIFFGLCALVFSLISGDQLVLLARVSFAGTAIMAPMVLAGILLKKSPGREVVIVTVMGLILFIASLTDIIPSTILNLRVDLFVFFNVTLVTLLSSYIRSRMDLVK